MKLRNFFIAAVVGLFGLAACEGVEPDLGVAKISIDPLELKFPKEESVLQVTLTATRDWNVTVSSLPEWIALSATEGKASANAQTISVTVEKNDGNDREASIVFNAGMVRATLNVKQAGEKGEYVVPTVTIAEFIKTDGQTEYIISGKVTSVNTDYQYAYINDGTAEVEVYKPSNWGEYADKIKIGATLKAQGVYTKYTNQSGKSYDELVGVILEVEEKAPQTDVETVTCAEFIKTDGATEYIISGKVTSMNTDYQYAYINDGTAEVEVYKPTNWSEYVDKIKVGSILKAQGVYTKYTNASGKSYDELVGVILSVEEGQTEDYSNAPAITVKEIIEKGDESTYYKLTGTVSKFNANYCSFDLTDATGTIYVYSVDNKADWTSKITDGGTVTLAGKYKLYKKEGKEDQPEIVNAVILSFQSGGDQPGPGGDETPSDPKGTGTQADPYNAAAANEAASALEAGAKSDVVYVSGKISSIKYQFDAAHGSATFNISDDGTTSGSQFTCYSVLYLENKAWVSGYSEVKVGDAVVICGKLTNYQGNTPETASKEAYIYSLNGVTEAGEPTPGDDPTTGDDTEFASNIQWSAGTNQSYSEKATVNGVANVAVLKLGTGKATGSSELTLPAGSTSLTFYALSWNGKPSKLVFKNGDTEVASVEPAANSGLANTSPYTLTVTDSDKYTITFDATTTLTVETSGTNTRCAIFGAIAK